MFNVLQIMIALTEFMHNLFWLPSILEVMRWFIKVVSQIL